MTPSALGIKIIHSYQQEPRSKRQLQDVQGHVKLKLPVFLYNLPHTWWLTCESIFTTYKMKNPSKKYNHLVASLPSDVTSKLLDRMTYPVKEASVTNSRLDLLKTVLMQRYLSTDFKSYCRFSTQKPLQPGQKPSALCDALCSCLPSHVDVNGHKYFFVNQFLALLPQLTKAQCLARKFRDITELAALTDKVHCQSAVMMFTNVEAEPDIIMACATAIKKTTTSLSTPPSSRNALCF